MLALLTLAAGLTVRFDTSVRVVRSPMPQSQVALCATGASPSPTEGIETTRLLIAETKKRRDQLILQVKEAKDKLFVIEQTVVDRQQQELKQLVDTLQAELANAWQQLRELEEQQRFFLKRAIFSRNYELDND